MVKLLVEHGADVNAVNTAGCTPLFNAVRGGHLSCVQYLIGEKAKVSVQDKNGTSLLHEAADGGFDDVLKLLLGAGATVRVPLQ